MSAMPDGGPITYKVILQTCQNNEAYVTEVFVYKTNDMHKTIKEIIRAQKALDKYKEKEKEKEKLEKEREVKSLSSVGDCCWGALKHGYDSCPVCQRRLRPFEIDMQRTR